jgi:hypothetical protein
MQDQVNATPAPRKRVPWNKGKLTGAKPPLRLCPTSDRRFGPMSDIAWPDAEETTN